MRTFLTSLLFLLLCLSSQARAEITAAESVEWLTVSSKIVAVGQITDIKKSKGEGSVSYLTYTLQLSEIIKGPAAPILSFTVRTLSTAGEEKRYQTGDELAVFLSNYKDDGENFLREKLIPISPAFPLSIVNLQAPEKYIIDIDFRVLKNREDILQVTRRAAAALVKYRNQNPAAAVNKRSIEVPMGSEAFASLFAGSSSYLIVPDFMLIRKKELPLRISQPAVPHSS